MIRGFKSMVLTSRAPEPLAAFYRDVLGAPLEAEQHHGTQRHWAGQLGAVHFAIHPTEAFWLPTEQRGFFSFDIDDADKTVTLLGKKGIEVVARERIGPMKFLAVRDPDGNIVCLGERWPGSSGRASLAR